MFQGLQSVVEGAVMERATLLVNHVISAVPAAVARLQPHGGAALQVRFTGWPSWLPPLPTVAYRVTAAGLLEWLGDEPVPDADLSIEVHVSNPALSFAHLLTGARPEVSVAGNATLAADVNWLIDNLRWDLEDDLAQVIGVGPAHQISRIARTVADGLRKVARTISGGSMDDLPVSPPGPLRR
jgi:ubiquinone biosynthesis protein UbiJ